MNLKVRFRNPVFWAQLILAILAPMLTYAGITAQDLTTWGALWKLLSDAISNPYVLFTVAVAIWNALNDPTTKGVADSERAMTYDDPA